MVLKKMIKDLSIRVKQLVCSWLGIGNPYGRSKNPPLIFLSNGDVEDFDPVKIAAAQKEVEERIPFADRHCKSLGKDPCTFCKMQACPVADQG